MPSVERSIVIDMPREEVFALSQDYDKRLQWDPFLRQMNFFDGAMVAGPGLRVGVVAHNGLSMEVEYVSYREPELVAMKMTKGPRFFATFGGSWRFLPEDADHTRVIFRYSFTTRWPLLRPLLDPIIRLLFGRDIAARLRGLKLHAEQ